MVASQPQVGGGVRVDRRQRATAVVKVEVSYITGLFDPPIDRFVVFGTLRSLRDFVARRKNLDFSSTTTCQARPPPSFALSGSKPAFTAGVNQV
jgi:hypothetical protein